MISLKQLIKVLIVFWVNLNSDSLGSYGLWTSYSLLRWHVEMIFSDNLTLLLQLNVNNVVCILSPTTTDVATVPYDLSLLCFLPFKVGYSFTTRAVWLSRSLDDAPLHRQLGEASKLSGQARWCTDSSIPQIRSVLRHEQDVFCLIAGCLNRCVYGGEGFWFI